MSDKLQRNRLWRKDPHCHWCGRLTVNEQGVRPDAATLDHVYSRLDFRRKGQGKHVLACWECNQARASAEVQSMVEFAQLSRADRARLQNQ